MCRVAVGLALSVVACGADRGAPGGGGSSTGTDVPSATEATGLGTTGPGTTGEATCPQPFVMPFRDAWRTEAVVPFPAPVDAEAAPIQRLTIGAANPFEDNFVNRGDVIVKFAATESITIELRRFTMATSEDLARKDFQALQLWAHASEPARPQTLEPSSDCTLGAWLDDCRILVYYDGQTQLPRSGADIRVTLPQTFRHELHIATTDNDAERTYPDRAAVCVENLHASADIELASGAAAVILADDAGPMPTCSAQDRALCDGWPDGNGSQAWAADCPCIANIGDFGRLEIRTLDGRSVDGNPTQLEGANITVDVVPGLWSSVRLANDQAGQDPLADCSAADPDGTCCATTDVAGYEPDPAVPQEPWIMRGALHRPSDAAVVGAGFRIAASSQACVTTATIAGPDAFACDAQPPLDTEAGNLRICDGCLRAAGCDALVP